LLASGGEEPDRTIHLWSLPDGVLLKTLSGHTGGVYSVAFSPDRRLLASAGGYPDDKTIKLWSLPDGALLRTLSGHTGFLRSVAIGPDGRLLASGSDDQTIRLWSLPDGKQLPVCLMDPVASLSSASGARYTKDGGTYTVPCGSPMPAGAVCTCNCVPGTSCGCVSACGSVYYYPN
jgi:WD40 repeat protein